MEISENFAIIIKKRGWLGRQWDRMHGKSDYKDDIEVEVIKKASFR